MTSLKNFHILLLHFSSSFSNYLKFFIAFFYSGLSFQRGITFDYIFLPSRAINQNVRNANFFEINYNCAMTFVLDHSFKISFSFFLGKMDEASRLMGNLLKNDANVQSLLGASKEEQERRLKERLEKRKQRKDAGMSEEEISELEQKEETEFEEEIAKKTTGNALQDLQVGLILLLFWISDKQGGVE